MTRLEGSGTIVGPAAVIDGRSALVLSRVLAGSLRGRLTLKQLVAEMRLSPADQAAALAAELALEDAGQTWRISQLLPQGGSPEVVGSKPLASSFPMSTTQAARLLDLSDRRVRWLAAACVIPAEKVGPRYVLERADVLAYREARGAA